MNFGVKLRTSEANFYVTSDLHFHHKGILEFCKGTRPFKDVNHMNESLIDEWNSVVNPDDYVFHLGDFSFRGRGATEEVLCRLNGNKVFILGNHDKTLRNQFKTGRFGVVYIGDYLEVSLDGVKVCMSHFPMTCFNQAGRGGVMLHGHTHGNYQGKGRTVDVGYDNWGSIITLSEAVSHCLKREVYTPDHH